MELSMRQFDTPRSPHVEIFRSPQGWHVRLVAANSQKLTVSEAYYSRWNAKRAARRVFPDHRLVVLEEATG